MKEKEPKTRKLKDKGEDVEPKAGRYDGEYCFGSLLNIDLKVCQKCKMRKACEAKLLETEGPQADDQSVQTQPSEKSNTIKIGKTDLHITYRDTTFFLLGLLCGVVL